jgi:hypothetical protein
VKFPTLPSSLVLFAALTVFAGCGSNSSETGGPEVDSSAPPAPATIVSAVDNSTGDVTITWAASSAPDLAGYEVESTTSGGSYTLAAELPSTTTEWMLPAVEGRAREWYRVRAVDTSANAGPWSRSIEIVRGEYTGGGGPNGDQHIEE